jgi:hypothetical protein
MTSTEGVNINLALNTTTDANFTSLQAQVFDQNKLSELQGEK